jgi:hypothetical protein
MFVKRLFLPCLTAMILFGSLVSAQDQPRPKLKDPLWTHGFDLKSRKVGEKVFGPDTQKFGVEALKDTNNNLGIYISNVGSIAVVNTGFANLNKGIVGAKGPDFVVGLDLPARKAGQTSWKDAKVHSVEVFHDTNTDNWIYVSEKGYLAATSAKGAPPAPGDPAAPRLSHSVDLNVRLAGDKEGKETKRFGVEVYLDPNTGNLVYVCETGSIAVIREDPASKVVGAGKDPKLLHGLDLKIRKHDEFEFTKAKKLGVEVYRDGNNGNLIYITENGFLAVAAGPKGTVATPTPSPKDPKWTHGMNMRCRKIGEAEFTDKTQQFGVEVFKDENVNVILYLAETGSLSAIKAP